MAESDPNLSAQDAQTANVRVGGVENRLSESDRLAKAESRLAEHDAVLKEREKAEQQAQVERQLAAAAVQQALQDAADASGKALEAALKNADTLEQERVERVRDEVKEVKTASTTLTNERSTAQQKFEENVKERFAQVNEFRGSLEDLGKSMGTRRELEQAQESFRISHNALSKEVSDLRSRVDVGPQSVKDLQAIVSEDAGSNRRGQEITASMFAVGGIVVILLSAIIGLVIKFA